MERQEAVKLIEEALSRLKNPSPNANGGSFQCGGSYWRLSQVLCRYLEPRLDKEEGNKHGEFIRKTHGVIVANKGVKK